MRSLRFVAYLSLMSLAAMALAQSETHRSHVPASDAQKAFDRLKSLAGNWRGVARMAHQADMDSSPVHVSLRVTSGGAALMHEMTPEGRADDPTRGDDDPITMLYLDGGRLLLTHYCDSGKNRPRMVGRSSPDGKTVDFEFLDVSGGTEYGHMQQASFTFVDADHHIEEWTYMTPAKQPARAHIELVRAAPEHP